MFRRFLCLAAVTLGFVSAGPLSAQTLQTAPKPASLWPELLQSDAARAYRAMRQLAAEPGNTLGYLRDAVPMPKRTATDKQVEILIRQLDSDSFDVRDKGKQDLELLDWQAGPALRKAVRASSTLELERRLEQLIGRLEGPPSGTNLRWHRAVEVAEWIGTAEAKTLLERWSKGAAASPLTVEANRAFKRWVARTRVDFPNKRPTADAHGDPLPAGAVLRLGSTRWRLVRGGIGYDRGGIVFTPDAKKLIIAGSTTIDIMDSSSGKALVRRPYSANLTGMQLSPDGRRLFVSGLAYGNNMSTPIFQILDAANLKELASWNTAGSIEGFVDDGKTIVLATDKGIRRLDAATGQEIAFTPYAKGVSGYVPLRAFNGKTIVVGYPGGRISVLDLAALDKVRKLDMPDRGPRSVALSANGKYLAIGGDYDYGVILYDLVRGQPIRHIASRDSQRDFVLGLAFAPDSKTLAFCSGNDNPMLVHWDLETHRPRWKVAGHAGQLVFSSDGKFIAGNGAWRTRLWDAATGKELSVNDASADCEGLAFGADGRTMVAVHTDAVTVLDFPRGKKLMSFAHRNVYRAALSPDGQWLATSSFNHDLRIWDAKTGKELSKLPDGGRRSGFGREFRFTGDSQRLCTWEADFRLLVWDVNTGRLLADHSPRPAGFLEFDSDDDAPRRGGRPDEMMLQFGQGFCFSADGAQLLWHFKKLRAYDTFTGKALRTFDKEISVGYSHPQISNDGELLLIGGGDRGVTLFNLRQGKILGAVPLAAGTYMGAYGPAPDGRSVAVETSLVARRRITIFETATLQPRLTLPLEYGSVNSMSFSPDGRFLAVTLRDGSALIWDLHAPGISTCAYSSRC